jgi:hypothetical protein
MADRSIIILARISDRITVEEWPGQTFWRWVVATELPAGHSSRCRSIQAYTTKAGALRAGRRRTKCPTKP